MADATSQRYDGITIGLHWLTAGLVVLLWIIGQTADWAPRGPLQTGYWSVHVSLGFVLALALAGRILWRGLRGRRLPPADAGALGFLAAPTHYALYGFLLAVVGLGIVNAVVRGYGLFGLFNVPQWGDPAWRKPITHWHGLGADVLLALALLHAAASLAHHYVMRDGVLRRMLPRVP
jgi:cytochrome b561